MVKSKRTKRAKATPRRKKRAVAAPTPPVEKEPEGPVAIEGPKETPREPPVEETPVPEVPEGETGKLVVEEVPDVVEPPFEDPVPEIDETDNFVLGSGAEVFAYTKEDGAAGESAGLYDRIFEVLDRQAQRKVKPRVVCIGGGTEGGGNPWYFWRAEEFLTKAILRGRVLSKAEIRPGLEVRRCDALGQYVIIC